MGFQWIEESPARWDASKASIFGRTAPGIFDFSSHEDGDLLSGEWWRVEDAGSIVGYGWMDCNWGDAEILLVVDPGRRKGGVGTFILDRIELEATARGVNYILNVIRPDHPDGKSVQRWLEKRGFRSDSDGRLLRRVVPATHRPH